MWTLDYRTNSNTNEYILLKTDAWHCSNKFRRKTQRRVKLPRCVFAFFNPNRQYESRYRHRSPPHHHAYLSISSYDNQVDKQIVICTRTTLVTVALMTQTAYLDEIETPQVDGLARTYHRGAAFFGTRYGTPSIISQRSKVTTGVCLTPKRGSDIFPNDRIAASHCPLRHSTVPGLSKASTARS